MNAGAEKTLGSPEPPKRPLQKPSKVSGIIWNAVCQVPLEVSPDKLIGVKLRRVSREVKGVNARMLSKELVDELGTVDGASVPEKNDGFADVPVKLAQEFDNLPGSDVPVAIKARVESKSLSSWRDRDSGDSRYLCPSSGNNEYWGLSSS